METKNIPLISKLRNLVTGGVSPFHTEVYFNNLVTMMDIPWGTPSQVTVKDPNYGYSYSAGASGSFGLKIIDGRKLLINLVGTEQEMSTANIQKYFKDLIVTRVKNCIAVELSRYSYNEFNQHLNDISENVAGLIRDELKNLDNSMAQKRFEAMGNRDAAVIEAQGLAKSREIQGYNWQQEQQFNVSKAFAENEGFAVNPANMMAQIPLAFSMGDMLKGNMEAAVNANNTMQNSAMNMQGGTMGVQGDSMNTQGASLVCSKCNSPLPQGAKFCMNCGEKVTPKEVYCQECGAVMPANAQFCMNCGTRRNV